MKKYILYQAEVFAVKYFKEQGLSRKDFIPILRLQDVEALLEMDEDEYELYVIDFKREDERRHKQSDPKFEIILEAIEKHNIEHYYIEMENRPYFSVQAGVR